MILHSGAAVEFMSGPDSAELFFESVLASNPFERNRISDPSQLESDVLSIHAEQFERLVDAAQKSLVERTARGMLLLGSAGTGKSHLLARLARWAAQRDACFVYLHNIQVRAADMSRYLLKCCLNRLAEDRREKLHETLLYRVIEAAVKKAALAEKIARLGDDNYREVCDRVSRRLGGEDRVFDAMFQFFFHASKAVRSRTAAKRKEHARLASLAVRWLKGDLLDADEARAIGQKLRPDQEVFELGDEQVGAVLTGIARLAAESNRPFLLCVDQADNMQGEHLLALAKSLHALIDAGQNLFIVLSGVKDDMLRLIDSGMIHAAAADRLQHRQPVELHWIRRDAARTMLRERLEMFLHVHSPLPSVCDPYRQQDDLFPLGSNWFAQLHPDSLELRPRDVLTAASDRWRQLQFEIERDGGERWLQHWSATSTTTFPALTPAEFQAAVDRKIDAKLQEAIGARRLDPGSLPADAGNLQGLTSQLLQQCVNRNCGYSLAGVLPPGNRISDLVVIESVDGQPVENHVVFVATDSRQSAAIRLRRLLNSPNARHRILVTDDERAPLPLPLGRAGAAYLEDLKALGPESFTHVGLTFEQYAELDALLAVVGQARSGDLEVEVPGDVRRISEDQVIDSYHRHDRYRQHVLLRLFLSQEPLEHRPRNGGLPRGEFREFVLAKLSFLMGANLTELLKGFASTLGMEHPTVDDYLPAAKEIVLEMHGEELVSAKPWDNDLYLTIGSKA